MSKNKKMSEVMRIIFSFLYFSFYYFFSLLLMKYFISGENLLIINIVFGGLCIVPVIIISMIIFKTCNDLRKKKNGAVFKAKIIAIISLAFFIAFGLVADSYNRILKKTDSNNIAVYGYREISEIIGETLKMSKNNGIWELKDLLRYLTSLTGVKYTEITNREGQLFIRLYKNIDKNIEQYDKNFIRAKVMVTDSVGVRLNEDSSDKNIVDLEYRIKFVNDNDIYYLNIGFQPAGQIRKTDDSVVDYQELFNLFFYIFSLLVLYLFGIISTYFIAKDFTNFFELTSGYMQRISKGDLNDIPSKNENQDINGFVVSFNRMLRDLNYIKKNMIEKERKNVWEEVSRRISHELKNPLTPIRLTSERLLLKYGKSDFEEILKKSVQIILTQVDTMEKKIADFADFSLLPGMSMFPGTVSGVVRQSIEKAKSSNHDLSCVLTIENDDVHVLRDPYSLEFVFTNAIEICLKENPLTENVFIEQSDINDEEGNFVLINFRGDGCELRNEKNHIDYIDDRFLNYKYVISVMRKIIEEHKGYFQMSGDTAGCLISICLPIFHEDADSLDDDLME